MPDNSSSTGSRITDSLAQLVEATGTDLGVTLLVSGVRIHGVMTSVWHYDAWIRHTLMIGVELGSMQGETTIDPPSREERQQAIDDLKDTVLRETGTHDSAFTAVVKAMSFPRIALRNAEVQTGVAAYWSKHPYLLINADHVDAITLGM